MIKLDEISEATLNSIISKKPNGIIIILPKKFSSPEGKHWEAIYKFFFDKSKAPDNIPTIPVNFIEESTEIKEIYQQFFSKEQTTKEKLFIVKNEEPKQIPQLTLDDFFGSMEEKVAFKTSKSNVYIVASYDSLLPSINMNSDLNSFKSGVLAQITLIRSLYKIFRNNGKIKYNVNFYLTSSRHNNFNEFKSFLKKPENTKLTENLEFIIALDSIGKDSELRFRTFDATGERNPVITTFFDNVQKSYNEVKGDGKVSFTYVKNDLFEIGIPVVHVSDSKMNIDENQARNLISKDFDEKSFLKNCRIILDALAKLAFDNETLFVDASYIDMKFYETTKTILESQSTSPAKIGVQNLVTEELHKIFKSLLKSTKKISTTIKNPKYYNSKIGKLIVLEKVSPFLDMYIFGGILAWLLVLYNVFRKINIKA